MKICRFDDTHIGVVDGDDIVDVSSVLEALPAVRWPVPPGDIFISNLTSLAPRIAEAARTGARLARSQVRLQSPVANPTKIIAAPVNYLLHQEEAMVDREINQGADIKTIDTYGLFLKANSSLVGPDEGVELAFLDRRIDFEVELALVIGRKARNVTRHGALDHVAGYAIGLDMSIRGTEDRSYRKSLDSFCVLGPWLVTADELPDPSALDLSLSIGGTVHQSSNTRLLIFDVPKLIEYASAAFTLYAGDIILTGTPEGVGPVRPGDIMHATVQGIGSMDVEVRG